MIYPTDLSAHQRFAVKALRRRPAILLDRRWRLKGAPSPTITEFALATLLGMGMVELQSPGVATLTDAGKRMAGRL